MGNAAADALEALTDFLYLVPVGLMQFGKDGKVQLANPAAAQLLMPLSPGSDMTDAYCAIAPLIPDLVKKVHGFNQPSGTVIDHQRCEVTSGSRSSVISVSVHRTHDDVNLAVLEDVTVLAEQERQIAADQRRFRAIFDNVRDYAIYTIDQKGLIEEWNKSLQRFGEWRPEDVIGKPFHMFFAESEGEGAADKVESLLATARTTGSVESEDWHCNRNGELAWTNTVLTALPDKDGSLRGYVVVSRDMTERKRLEDELRRLANTDPLTGAMNRRAGQSALREMIESVADSSRQTAVLMLDIDHFKTINDQYGHEAGDAALCALVTACRQVLGDDAKIVRWGGEEFLVILETHAEIDILAAAESLRAGTAALRVKSGDTEFSMTISIGVTIEGSSAEQMVRNADIALYRAKRKGRDQVFWKEKKTD